MRSIFQVAEVKKPLISVKRIIEIGKRVYFGPGAENNYIEKLETEDKVSLRKNVANGLIMKSESELWTHNNL